MNRLLTSLLSILVIALVACSEQQISRGGPGGSSETTASGDSVLWTLPLEGDGPWEVRLLKGQGTSQAELVSKIETDEPIVELLMDTSSSYQVTILTATEIAQYEVVRPLILVETKDIDALFDYQYTPLDTMLVSYNESCDSVFFSDNQHLWEWDNSNKHIRIINPQGGLHQLESADCHPYYYSLEIDIQTFGYRWVDALHPSSVPNNQHHNWHFTPPTNWVLASELNDEEGFFGKFSQNSKGVQLDSGGYFISSEGFEEDVDQSYDNSYAVYLLAKFNSPNTPILNFHPELDQSASFWLDDSGYVRISQLKGLDESFTASPKSSRSVLDEWGELVINVNFDKDILHVYWKGDLILDLVAHDLGLESLKDNVLSIPIDPISSSTNFLALFADAEVQHQGVEINEVYYYENNLTHDQAIGISAHWGLSLGNY